MKPTAHTYNPLNALLYTVIFIEGYVVLATEILTIRQLIPFVGNGTETVAIVIAAVLMPLALGYYHGGQYNPQKTQNGTKTIRKRLILNIRTASLFIILGLSYMLLEIYFSIFSSLGIHHRILQTTTYSVIFLIYPIYLLGQTIPLTSHYFAKSKLSKATGKMLFFSTSGSFLGAILTTLILMGTIGVNNTLIFTTALLALLIALLNKNLLNKDNFIMLVFLGLAFFLNANKTLKAYDIVSNNNYSTIAIKNTPDPDERILSVNRSYSAKYTPDPNKRFHYVQYIEKNFITPLMLPGTEAHPSSILVIGAGGFTIGIDDHINRYTFVDIDPSLKALSEHYLLHQKIGHNKHFAPLPARAFLNNIHQQFDLIILDAYSNYLSLPFQLITQEFFQQVKQHLKPHGIMVFNAISSPNFNDAFSIKLDNTLHQVFPNINRQVISPFNAWDNTTQHANILYSYFNHPIQNGIYTDNKNNYFFDRS